MYNHVWLEVLTGVSFIVPGESGKRVQPNTMLILRIKTDKRTEYMELYLGLNVPAICFPFHCIVRLSVSIGLLWHSYAQHHSSLMLIITCKGACPWRPRPRSSTLLQSWWPCAGVEEERGVLPLAKWSLQPLLLEVINFILRVSPHSLWVPASSCFYFKAHLATQWSSWKQLSSPLPS